MKNVFNGLINDAETLMISAMIVMSIWFAIWTWIRTKALAPTIGALLLGAVVVWGVSNVRGLRDQVNEDINPYVQQGG
jgi:hypothetical protein